MEADYQKYDQIWQRVSPELNPYPEARAAREQAAHTTESKLVTLPSANDPCCMGDDARADLEVIRGFLRDELADTQTYRCLVAQAPTAEGKRLMRRMAADEAAHAKMLQSVHFLITGETYSVAVVLPPQPKLLWRDRLRARYHEEACGGFNYARAAEETTDFCLKKVFGDLSKDEYRHADWLRRLLAKAL